MSRVFDASIYRNVDEQTFWHSISDTFLQNLLVSSASGLFAFCIVRCLMIFGQRFITNQEIKWFLRRNVNLIPALASVAAGGLTTMYLFH